MESALVSLELQLRGAPAWLSPHAPLLNELLSDARARSIVEALNAARDGRLPDIRFVEQSALPTEESYEGFIARTRCVPTRENLHDLVNGVMWLSYPQTKRRLNALQAAEIERHGTSGPRGALRDALTLFDENAAILSAPAELADALRRRDWQSLFVAQRAQWQSANFVLFGHALLEKLVQPRKAITAHVWLVNGIDDGTLASSITPERLITKPFLPLPVLGVPGWWPPNEHPEFYDDPSVFRSVQLDGRR